jgi:hypothetical protein
VQHCASLTAMESQGDDVGLGLVRGVNWAPDSCDESEQTMEEEIQGKCGESMSEVRFVKYSLAGEIEVPDSQEALADVDQTDVVDAVLGLLRIASTDVSTFKSDKELHAAKTLLLPVFLPRMYGCQDEVVNEAVISLFLDWSWDR